MNDIEQPVRRIVSKGEYARAQGKRVGLAADAIFLFVVAWLCFKNAPLLGSFMGAATAMSSLAAYLPLLIPVVGLLIFVLGRAASVRLREAMLLDAGVPHTRATTADLPAPDSLVRASTEPMQAQQAVLLRAGASAHPHYEEQLMRATVGVQE